MTTYKYNDSLGRLTETDYPDTGQTTLSYNDSTPSVTTTKLISTSPSVSLTTTATMDGLAHVTQTLLSTDPDGPTYTATAYDGNGRSYQVYNPTRCSTPTTNCGTETTWGFSTSTYDGLGRITNVAEPDGSAVATSYSANCTTVTDEVRNARESCVDGLGRMTSVVEAPNNPSYEFLTTYVYDPLGDLTSVTQNGNNSSNARIRTFVYDSLTRLTSASNPESGAITYGYDANGNLQTRTAPSPNQVSTGTYTVATSYAYDALNRITGKSYNDSDTSNPQTVASNFGYDAVAPSSCATNPPTLTDTYPKGRRTAMCDGSGATSWSHDKMGRALSEKRDTDGVTQTTSNTYNLDGSLSTLTYPSTGEVITYAPGGAGRPTAAQDLTNSINYVESATYAPSGGLTSMVNGKTASLAGITTTNAYNDRLQPILLSAVSPSGTVFSLCYDFHLGVPVTTPSPCSFSASTLGDNGNVYQVLNNRTGDSGRTGQYTYDALNRIASGQSTGTQWGETFTIDPWGNLTNETGIAGKTYNEGLNTTAGTNNQLAGFGYDAAGNMSTNSPSTYKYDAENRLVTTGGYTYYYDGDGNRVAKINGSISTVYWRGLDGNTLLESSLTGTNQEAYVFFNGSRVARLDVAGSVAHYYFSDYLGSSSVVENATGSACEQDIDYYPYGGVMHDYCPTVTQHYRFTGKERDSESGLDYFGFRYNASSMGRFMSPDPSRLSVFFTNPQSWNRYSYVYNNPPRLTDDNGKWPTDIHNQIIDNSFSNLTAAQRQILKNVSAQQDSILGGGQANSASFEHAMRGPDQTVEQAQGQFNDFVSGTETSAQTAEWTFWLNDPDNEGSMSDEALARFGEALHAILDSTSPAHAGFQKWDWRNPALVIAHHNAEKTINPQQMQNAINAARSAFNSTFGMFGFTIATEPKATVTVTVTNCVTDSNGKKTCDTQ